MKIIYGWKLACKICITYENLSMDLYSYVKSALHTELSRNSNLYITSTLNTDLHPRY